jgi:hypothetical protein
MALILGPYFDRFVAWMAGDWSPKSRPLTGSITATCACGRTGLHAKGLCKTCYCRELHREKARRAAASGPVSETAGSA